jgi:hypothetical protein
MTAGMSRGKAVSAFFRCTGILRGRAGKTIERAACRRKLSAGRQLRPVPMLLSLDFHKT